jgi:tRNA(Ile)-lysidine synthase
MKADLLERFTKNAETKRLFNPGDQIIVAVSGGGDSLAMLDLLSRTGQQLILAHCNFQLRHEESDADEQFVRKLAVIYDYPLYVETFNTRSYARENGLSLEMAARELRYRWFDTLLKDTGSAAVAVAHHADDSVETMIINLVRGTGLRGLTGIKPRQGKIVRPMLFANRQEILEYLNYRQLEYRTDSSNRDIRFARNRIRHEILVDMEMINPGVKKVLLEEQVHFDEALKVAGRYLEMINETMIIREEDRIKISIGQLLAQEFTSFVLFETLRPFGYNSHQVSSILESIGSGPGKIFSAGGHTLLIDRDFLIVAPFKRALADRYYIDPVSPPEGLPIDIAFSLKKAEGYAIPNDPGTASLDAAKIDQPLILRKWEKGDFFQPLGMNQSKKISDFFIDKKINRLDKSEVWILTSGEQIVWVVGHRIDHRFRITKETTEILEIRVC